MSGTDQWLDTFDTYHFDTNTWSRTTSLPDIVTGAYPKGRSAFGCAQCEHHVIIGGGRHYDMVQTEALDDVWILDLMTLRWQLLSLRLPMELFFHTLCINRAGTLYLFGGVKDDKRQGVLYEAQLYETTLAERSWRVFLQHTRYLQTLKPMDLLAHGVPALYVQRLPKFELKQQGLSCAPS